MNECIAVILAGGDSSRMWPLSKKMLIPFGSTSFLSSCIDGLLNQQVTRILVVSHSSYLSQVQQLVERYPHDRITVCEQTDDDGMAGAVRSVASHIAGQPVLILGASDWYEPKMYTDVFEKIHMNPDKSFLTAITVDTYFPGGYITSEHGVVTGLIEKPDPASVPSHHVAIVCDYFSSSDVLLQAVDRVGPGTDDTFERAIMDMIKHGIIFSLYEYRGYWGHLKYPWHILEFFPHLLALRGEHRGERVYIDERAVLSGPIYIEDDVRILEYAKIIGPCFIGKGTIVGNFTMIRDSWIEPGCVIGKDTEITRSYIGPRCWFHKNYIGDSVLAEEVYFGGGALTANYRLDSGEISSWISEKKYNTKRDKLGAVMGPRVHVGVNTSIMPGVKIGKDSLIGSGIVLDADIPDGMFCKPLPRSYHIVQNRNIKTSS